MARADQPYLLLDIHVRGQHFKNLAKAIVTILDLQLKPSRLHFYAQTGAGYTEPIEHVQ